MCLFLKIWKARTFPFWFSLQQKHICSLVRPLDFSTKAAHINGIFFFFFTRKPLNVSILTLEGNQALKFYLKDNNLISLTFKELSVTLQLARFKICLSVMSFISYSTSNLCCLFNFSFTWHYCICSNNLEAQNSCLLVTLKVRNPFFTCCPCHITFQTSFSFLLVSATKNYFLNPYMRLPHVDRKL